MEIKLLRYFRAVVETGSLTKATSLLHITPGALSKSVHKLEDESGKTLFSRAGRSLALTEQGQALYLSSERLVEEHRRLLKSLDASEPTSAPTLRIASFEVFTTHCLGAIARALRPELALHVLELRVGDIERAVAEGESDFGITYAPFPSRELHHQKLGRTEFGIFTKRGAFRNTPFAEIPFAIPIVPLEPVPAELLGIDSWPYEKVPRLVKYRLTSLESALELARRGQCAVFIPIFIAALHNRTVKRDTQLQRLSNPKRMSPVWQRVYLVTRVEDRGSPLARDVADAVRTAISA